MADLGEGPPLFLDQTRDPPLSQGLDDRPPLPLSEGLDPPLN